MAECTHDCSTCSSKCDKQSLIEPMNKASNVKKVIGIVSGKGGVGKSLVTSMLAVTMQRRGYQAAILDADIMLGKLRDHLIEKGITLTYTRPVLSHIAEESFSDKYGARNMRRFIERSIEDVIANIIIDAFPSEVSGIGISISGGKLKFDSI